MADLAGKILGNYRVVERIGRGGMAAVYKAYQPALERHVAIKVILQQLTADDDQFLKRFQREAKAVAALRHPNIVQVFDFGVQDDISYMVMEYLEGASLKAELTEFARREEIIPLEEAWRIFQAVASAVEFAHSQGMVHRDIKPANVMLTVKGDVILTDFGIARILGGTQYTATGAVIGTPAYLSPEQGKGERGDERSDIYALGIMLYEMVTGRVPFDADTPLAVIFQHISDPLPLPSELNPDISEGVEQVILKALAKEPDDRYQTVTEMIDAFADARVAPSAEPDESISTPVASTVQDEDTFPQTEVLLELTGSRRNQGVRFSQRTWQGMALGLFLLALSCGACGLLLGAMPKEPTENMPNPETTYFWVTRGCFLGPAFSLVFLAYSSLLAGRRKGRSIRCSELATALSVALGLIPVLLGLAIIVQPIPDEADRVVGALLCLLPGLFIVGVSGIFWAVVVREKRS